MRSFFVLLFAANAAKCKKKTRDLGIKKEIDKLGLMKCAECPKGATGSSCQLCLSGYFRQNKKCVKCKCQKETSFGGCTRRGRCRCFPRFAGRSCSKCADGFEHFPKCTPVNKDQECLCHPISSWSVCPSRDHGRCSCKSTKYGGRFCNECAPGRVDFPNCEFETGFVKNSDLAKNENGQILLKRKTRHLQRQKRQYYSQHSIPYDLNQRLSDLERKQTELVFMWEDIEHHVEEKTRYLEQFLMDEEGMVPVFNDVHNELEKMVADVDKNMCQKVASWEYFEEQSGSLRVFAENTNSAVEEIEDLKKLKNELATALEHDDLLLSNEAFDELVKDCNDSIARLDSISERIIEEGNEIICRSKRIDEIEEVIVFFQNQTEISSPKINSGFAINCTEEDDLDAALKSFEDDRDMLDKIDSYEGDVSKLTKKNNYKMEKIDRFLEQYFENDFNELDELANHVKCNQSQIQTQITEFSNQWLRIDKKMPPKIIQQFCTNETNDCATKYEDDIECRENSDAMKEIFNLFEEFDTKLREYEDAVAESVQILTENGDAVFS
ncbi:unnamed protein product [Oikopleura dioica]|uniref:Laminin EGF-like domain-containing protein n=1 Tax=Oikopleura dioica TaxID=34765 RepID=E4XN98_OIKDI|nr:unnamed protein product [Oikopleura dioica]